LKKMKTEKWERFHCRRIENSHLVITVTGKIDLAVNFPEGTTPV